MRFREARYCISFFVAILLLTIKTHAQDPHFSQYFSSPLTFNPSFAGYFNGNSRLSVNLRRQWSAIGDVYNTGTASFDTRILKNQIGSNDRWGIGVHGLYDQSAGGIYKSSYLSVSTAFHKGLDEEGDQTIGIGVQASYAYSSIDFSRISFSNQFNGSGFDLSLPSGEIAANRRTAYVDLNAGLLYNFTDESGTQFSLGAAVFHLLSPRLSFYPNSTQTIAPRYTIHAGANFASGEKNHFFVSAHMMQQGGASEYVLGAAYGIATGQNNQVLNIGTWLRAKDAFYPYIGLQTPTYQLGITYDITSSDISRIQRFTGGMELSFTCVFNTSERKKAIPCFF